MYNNHRTSKKLGASFRVELFIGALQRNAKYVLCFSVAVSFLMYRNKQAKFNAATSLLYIKFFKM